MGGVIYPPAHSLARSFGCGTNDRAIAGCQQHRITARCLCGRVCGLRLWHVCVLLSPRIRGIMVQLINAKPLIVSIALFDKGNASPRCRACSQVACACHSTCLARVQDTPRACTVCMVSTYIFNPKDLFSYLYVHKYTLLLLNFYP